MQAINTDFVLRMAGRINDAVIGHQKILEFISHMDSKNEEALNMAAKLERTHRQNVYDLKKMMCDYVNSSHF
jgi:hypothetical protein